MQKKLLKTSTHVPPLEQLFVGQYLTTLSHNSPVHPSVQLQSNPSTLSLQTPCKQGRLEHSSISTCKVRGQVTCALQTLQLCSRSCDYGGKGYIVCSLNSFSQCILLYNDRRNQSDLRSRLTLCRRHRMYTQ